MKISDPDIDDILFLDRHPGWSWADLDGAPLEIVDGLKRLDFKRASRA